MKATGTSSRSHTRTKHAEPSPARDHYHREKARRARQARPDSELLAAAKREYLALLAADAEKGKGGRPKKKAARPAAVDDDDTADEHEGAEQAEEGEAEDE